MLRDLKVLPKSRDYGMREKMLQWKNILPILIVLCSCSMQNHSVPTQHFSYSNILDMGHETGIASWYGSECHGKKTANGELYNMYAMTAAHKTLPFGSHVKVTNMANKRSVEVRINDRGPFIKKRIIDLSYAAAKALDIVDSGIAMVQVEVTKKAKYHDMQYTIQVGSFKEKRNALDLKKELQKKYNKVYVVAWTSWPTIYYRVRVGYFRSNEEVQKVAQRLVKEGYSVLPTWRY